MIHNADATERRYDCAGTPETSYLFCLELNMASAEFSFVGGSKWKTGRRRGKTDDLRRRSVGLPLRYC